MDLELALDLRDHRDHAGVVRARAHLAEPDVVALHEELHAEDAAAAQVVGHALRDVAGARERDVAHRLRLPALDVVAPHLHMADRLAE